MKVCAFFSAPSPIREPLAVILQNRTYQKMGTWNTGILENDEAMDVYGFFERLYYKQQLDIEEIKAETLSHFNLVNEKKQPVFGSNEWLAYAQICWECKALDEKIINVVKEILQNKEDIQDDWEELTEKRIAEIEKFLSKIQRPAKRKKIIKKIYSFDIPFQEGDCILVKCKDGKYSVVILIEIDKSNNDPNMWNYFIGTTRIYQSEEPTFEDVLNSHFFVVNYGENLDEEKANWINDPHLWIRGYFIGNNLKKEAQLKMEQQISECRILGNVKFSSDPKIKKSYSLFWLDWSLQLATQIKWEQNNPNSIDLSYALKKYIEIEQPARKKSWKFWK